jgi:uncharacterized caspase-like protein
MAALWLAVLWLAVLPGAAWADAGRRVALVIGNNDYQHVSPLVNAVADARAFRRELEQRGFDVVYRENAGRRAMNGAVEEFVGKLSSDAVSVIYYSGHGVQINSANYLIPVDLQAEKEADVAYDAVDLSRLVDRVSQTQAKFTLAVIDACRNNPFQGTGRSIGGTKGLAAPSGNASGVMVVYSAGANQQALDRLGNDDRDPNGLFTREFLKVMRVPGLKVQDAVNQVKMEVITRAKGIGHLQTPAIYDQSVGTFMFTPGAAAPAGADEASRAQQDVVAAKAELERIQAEQRRIQAEMDGKRQQQAAAPPAATGGGPPSRPAADWKASLSAFDTQRLGRYGESWKKAWAEMEKERPQPAASVVSLVKTLGGAEPRPVGDSELNGNFHCRVLKIGGLVTVLYDWKPCRLSSSGGVSKLEKTGGSQRTSGRLLRHDDKTLIYAGAWRTPEMAAVAYDPGEPKAMNCNDYRNEVGVFYKIWDKHFLLGLPEPLCESSFDMMEISATPYP